MADLIISQPMTFTVDVKNGLVERPQRESLMRGDKMANRIIAELVYGSEPFDITGVTVKGKFCRPPSGDEIDLAGEAKGNVAEVQLTDQCYTSGGHYEARVILVLGGVERTVLFISGDVLKSGSGNAAGDEETGGSGGSTGSGLPAGGTAGQVLVKVSSAQGDAIWKTLTAAGVGALPSDGTAVNANALNGKDAKYYLSAQNLLDNSNFLKFIAQAGVSGTHGTATYAGDRWILSSGTITGTANSNGDGYSAITLNGTIYQKVAEAPTTATAAIGMVSGTATIEYSDGVVTITSAGGVIAWAALYEGSYTADNLPPYVPKGYAAELAECQRYHYPLSGTILARFGGSTAMYVTFQTPVPMRTTPSLSEGFVCGIYHNGQIINVTAFKLNTVVGNYVNLICSKEDAGISLTNTTSGGYVNSSDASLSADL